MRVAGIMTGTIRIAVCLLCCCAILLVSLRTDAFSGSVSDEAKRFFNRGVEAVKLAKSPEDYVKAIQEFEKAAQLAPDWPDVYFNLGMVQEKAERYQEAIASLRQYLRLAPNAADAAKVREHIYKLEYKAENILTSRDIADILASFGKWQKIGECHREELLFVIKREGPDRVRVLTSHAFTPPEVEYTTLKVEGPIIKFTTKVRSWSLLDPGLIRMFGTEGFPYENQIEVVSREHVIVKQKSTLLHSGQVNFYSCEYFKK